MVFMCLGSVVFMQGWDLLDPSSIPEALHFAVCMQLARSSSCLESSQATLDGSECLLAGSCADGINNGQLIWAVRRRLNLAISTFPPVLYMYRTWAYSNAILLTLCIPQAVVNLNVLDFFGLFHSEMRTDIRLVCIDVFRTSYLFKVEHSTSKSS